MNMANNLFDNLFSLKEAGGNHERDIIEFSFVTMFFTFLKLNGSLEVDEGMINAFKNHAYGQ